MDNSINSAANDLKAGQEETHSLLGDVIEAVTSLPSLIIDGLKSLFIPSDDFFKTYFDDLYSWFSDKFGFLTIPLDIFIQIIGIFTSSSEVDFVVTLPALTVVNETVWKEQSFNMTEFLNTNFSVLVSAIRFGTSVLLVFGFLNLCRRKYNEVMRN